MKFDITKITRYLLYSLAIAMQISCSSPSDGGDPTPTPTPTPNPPATKNEVDYWLTKSDQSVLLTKQNAILSFGTLPNAYASIEVNDTQTFQSIDGFGYTLTGGSADVINQLTATKKKELLQELFGSSATSIGVSYIRISIGASDLNAAPFTYNDLPAGDTDLTLSKFSLAPDKNGVIAILKEILAINPNIKVLATPWSAPRFKWAFAFFVDGDHSGH